MTSAALFGVFNICFVALLGEMYRDGVVDVAYVAVAGKRNDKLRMAVGFVQCGPIDFRDRSRVPNSNGVRASCQT